MCVADVLEIETHAKRRPVDDAMSHLDKELTDDKRFGKHLEPMHRLKALGEVDVCELYEIGLPEDAAPEAAVESPSQSGALASLRSFGSGLLGV